MRTAPSGLVSTGTNWAKCPDRPVRRVGTVITESIVARLRSDPTRWATPGVRLSPPRNTWPESGTTLTRGMIGTSLCATESSVSSISSGITRATSTSTPLGTSTSLLRKAVCQTDPEKVSGTARLMTRGKVRSLSSSRPLPVTTTDTPGGALSNARPRGTSTASLSANVCVTVCWLATATYSISDRNSAAILMGQLRSRPRFRLSGIEQTADQCFVDGPIPFRRPDHLLHDLAVAIDHERFRDAGRLVAVLNLARAVVHDVEAEAQLVDEPVDHGRVVLVDTHGDHAQVGPRQLAL